MVYEIKCDGCGSIRVGQTRRYVTASISEHQRKNLNVGHHLVECGGSTNDIEWKVFDACSHSRKTHDRRSYIRQQVEGSRD